MFNEQNKFRFISQIMDSADEDSGNSEIHHFLPNVYETIVMSKDFDDYNKCLETCNEFLKYVVEEINSNSKSKYVIIWNENPKYSIKKIEEQELEPWEDDEIVKLYVAKLKDIKNKKIPASIKTTIYVDEDKQNIIGSHLTH